MARDYAGQPRSEANKDLKTVDDYEKHVGKVKKDREKTLRDQGDSGSDNDSGLSSKLPK